MKRLMKSIYGLATPLLLLFLALPARAGNYCNNPVPPCDPFNPTSDCYRTPAPPPKCEPRTCGKCTKSPCYVGSGVYAFDARDLEIETTGFPITVSRLYQSSQTIDGESGHGWISSLSTRLYYAVFLKAAPSTYQKEVDIRLPNGPLYRYVENADGSFTPPEGRFDTLVRNGDGTWDLWLQQTHSRYHFSATGNLLTMVDDNNNTLTWTYVNDRLQRIEDSSGSGRYIDITYGADGRISDVTDMTGRNVHYTYNTSGVMNGVTNPAGQTTAYSYVNGKYVPLLNGVTDHWGRNITTVVYDAQDRVRSYTDQGETYTYTYNFNGIATTTAKADSSGNTWQYPFGSGGLVTDSQPPGGGPADHQDFYSNGLLQMYTDAAGVKTYYTYNDKGLPLTITVDYQGPTAVEWRIAYDTNFPEEPATVKAYDPATNQIHPHWQGARFEYHPAGSNAPGQLHRFYKFDNDGATARLTATFTYDTHGRILTSTDAGGNTTNYGYDASGNLATVERPANNDAGIRPITTYIYDTLGRVTSITDPEGRLTTYTWDVLDRIKTLTLPKPSASSPLTFTTSYFYDEYDSATQLLFGRVVDPNGRVTKTGYDQYGHALQSIDQAGNVTRSVYTKGLLTAQTDPNNYSKTFSHDARRRQSTITFFDGTTELFTYNADNTLASKRDRAGQTVTFTYDRHKRVAVRTYPNNGTITQTYQGQKLVQIVDTFASPSETHAFSYDNSFRVTSNTQGSRGTVNFTWTADDLPATVSLVGGATTTYGYYPSGSLRTLVWSAAPGTFRYDYTLAGRPQLLTFPNGQTRGYTYDEQGRTTQVANIHPTAGNIATFVYGYDYDAFTGQPTQLAQRTSVTATVPALGLTSALTKFGYDARYALVQAGYPTASPYNGLTQSWTYDAAGNRLTATENGVMATYLYNKYASNPLNSPRLQSDGGNAYTYDAKGNVLTRSGTRGNFTFTYDHDNRLRTVSGDESASYQYDYDGRRALTTLNGASTSFVYAGNHAIAESGASVAQYLFGAGIDEPLAVSRNGQIYYYAVDGVDSVVVMSDTGGTPQSWYAWDAFGTARARQDNVPNRLGYTAREFTQAGLHYYRFRHYEPATGRFLSEDPLQESLPILGGDLYGYVKSSPVMYKDPFGLECFTLTFPGPWVYTGEYGMGEVTKLIRMEAWPFITRNPFWRRGMPWWKQGPIPPVGTLLYTCLWQRYLHVVWHMKRTVAVKVYCICPPAVDEHTYEEQTTKENFKYLGTFQTQSIHTPCANIGQ